MTEETVQRMPWTVDFHVQHERPRSAAVIDGSKGEDTANAVNASFSNLISTCIDKDLFHVLDHKHSEPFAILGAKYPVHIERFATGLFGVTACGAHLVAYVKNKTGLKLWIPRRSTHLYSAPGKLDTTVAGGVTAGTSPLQTILHEAEEEASLSGELVQEGVRARGVMTTMCLTGEGWRGEKGLVFPDLIYLYDIELPDDVLPKPHDDEVESFNLMTIEKVQAALLSNEFKIDSAAVLVDFMIRHAIITAENEPNYADIIQHLHRRLPFRLAPPT